jgi:hypothetical protein
MKRLILLSDLDGEFGDDQIDTVIAGIKNSGAELNVIVVRLIMFNVSFNNISVISWRSGLLVGKTGGPGHLFNQFQL